MASQYDLIMDLPFLLALPSLSVSHVSLASLRGNADSHAVCGAEGQLLGSGGISPHRLYVLARCAIQSRGGRSAGGG